MATHRRSVGHSHVLAPDLRHETLADGVAVRMLHKAAHRLRRLGYHTERLTVLVDLVRGPRWVQPKRLSPTRDTLTLT